MATEGNPTHGDAPARDDHEGDAADAAEPASKPDAAEQRDAETGDAADAAEPASKPGAIAEQRDAEAGSAKPKKTGSAKPKKEGDGDKGEAPATGTPQTPWWKWPPRLPAGAQRLLGAEFYFVVSWMALNAMFNVRAPAREPPLWYLLPSLDVVVLLGLLALVGAFKRRVPRVVLFVGVALALFARSYWLADGIIGGMYHRSVNAFVDLPMVPELVRLMLGTVPALQLLLLFLGALALLALVSFLNYRALFYCAHHLTAHRHRMGFLMIVLVLGVVSLLPVRLPQPELFDGAFAASLVPRLRSDYRAYQRSSEFAEDIKERIQKNRERLSSGEWNVRGLGGANVYILFFESYGETLVARDVYRKGLFEQYARMESALGGKGFSFASTIYDSPTVGGYSWFAHSTLATGIKVTDQKQFFSLRRAQPPTIVQAFREAGYMTTTVNPATMRQPKGPDLYGFERHFYSWEFGYRGVNFSWAPMPDQFALDYVRRNHIEKLDRPLFLEYGMVSSHAPWNDQAPLIADWDQIGDGSIYRNIEHVRFPTTWDNLDQAEGPYLRSVIYVLEVLLRYMHAYVKDDSLFIILGDHQPVGEITDHTEDRGVIMHVISRNSSFTDKFVRRGFARGMQPKSPTPRLGMEAFMPAFFEAFSEKE